MGPPVVRRTYRDPTLAGGAGCAVEGGGAHACEAAGEQPDEFGEEDDAVW